MAEAVHRIINPAPVNGKLMFFLSLTGIAVNVLNLLILGGHHHHGVGGHDHSHDHSSYDHSHSHGHSHNGHSHSHERGGHSHGHDHDDEANINLRGAVIHVLGDFVQSIGVAVAGALIWWKQVQLRPVISLPQVMFAAFHNSVQSSRCYTACCGRTHIWLLSCLHVSDVCLDSKHVEHTTRWSVTDLQNYRDLDSPQAFDTTVSDGRINTARVGTSGCFCMFDLLLAPLLLTLTTRFP